MHFLVAKKDRKIFSFNFPCHTIRFYSLNHLTSYNRIILNDRTIFQNDVTNIYFVYNWRCRDNDIRISENLSTCSMSRFLINTMKRQ